MTATRTLLIASLRLVVVEVWDKTTRPETRTNANSCILYFFVLSLHACLWQTPPSLSHLCITLQVSRFRSNRCPKQLKLLMLLAYNDNVNHVRERSAFGSFLFTLVQCRFLLDGKGRGENSTNILNATRITSAPMAFCLLSSPTPYFCLACSWACKTSCQKC